MVERLARYVDDIYLRIVAQVRVRCVRYVNPMFLGVPFACLVIPGPDALELCAWYVLKTLNPIGPDGTGTDEAPAQLVLNSSQQQTG